MNKQMVLRILLAVVSISQLLLGLLAVLAPPETITHVVAAFYGATLQVTPVVQHVLRILGAFMITIGMLAMFAFFNPTKHANVIDCIVLLLVLRVGQRLLFAQEIHSAFGVSYAQLWGQSAFFLAFALALFLLRPRLLCTGALPGGKQS